MRDCIIKEQDLIDYAIELGHKAVAITDHETIASAIKVEQYYNKIKETHPDFKVIRGNEIYLVRDGLNADNYNREIDRYYHFILIAKDLEGFRQICEISTRAWQRSYMGRGMRRVPTYYNDLFEIIGANPGHVIGSTACLGGALPVQILRGTSEDKLAIWMNQLKELFGEGNFYLEMQPSHNKDQITVNKKLLEFSYKYRIPYIITTDSHYLKREDRTIHKAYLNAQDGDREVDEFYATTYMMGTEELESYFKYFQKSDLLKAYSSFERIIDMCEDYTLTKPLKIPELKWQEVLSYYSSYPEWFERLPALQKFYESPHKSDKYLVNAVIDGIKRHPDLQNEEAYTELNLCLEDTWESSEVNNARWSAYFLNLQSIIATCWEAGTIIGPSRGSGGGFVLLYCLDIIQLNALRETTRCYRWRFLNPQRASVLDIDTDIEGGKRAQVLQHLRDVYGEDRVANVATFRTEKSKSAIQTAARGLGIDVDIAQYISSLIPADRGQLRSLDQCMYGDEEHGWKPISQFVNEMTENYPELWTVAHGIEGLICGSGIHAGGVIFVDEPFTNSTALMRAPDGTICTQFELHDAEAASLIKMDLLSVEAMDKIHNCIDLLCEYGYAERKPTLKETYESIVGIYGLERDDPKMWDMVWNHKITSLFQMEKSSGVNGIALAHPASVDELAVLNSVIRLMAPDPGAEQPLNMWARYRKDLDEWIEEMRNYGLTEDQIEWLKNNNAITSGICESQEGLMSLIQDDNLGGNSLSFADKCRKAIAKKQGKLFEECEAAYFENAKEKGCDMRLVHYVWDILLRVQRGYSFCKSHTLAYSLIALQEMNLAYKYPIIFWNCACLISDAGGAQDDTEEDEEVIEELKSEPEYFNEMEDFGEDDVEDGESYEEEDCDGLPVEVVKTTDGKKKKKKIKTTDYGRIATAIGKMRMEGINISAPDINQSSYTFSPDIENNSVRYGLSGIARIGSDLVKRIMANRPYGSIEDFLNRINPTKPQMVNLIKSGAFDSFGDRQQMMIDYINMIYGEKKAINLRNLQMLINYELLPEKYAFQIKCFNFNKYLKKFKRDKYYDLDSIAFEFYNENFDIDKLTPAETESGFSILQTTWDAIWKKQQDILRPHIKANEQQYKDAINSTLFNEMWDKYCEGSVSKWEMDAVSYYSHAHELADADLESREVSNYFDMPEEPELDRLIPIKGKMVPLFKIKRIAGTILDKDKNHKTISLLTLDGVVTVKIYGGAFANYDRQISVKGDDGKKHVIEKSMLARGNKVIITGIRRGDEFVAKTYARTPYHLVELIEEIYEDGSMRTRSERAQV